MKRKYRLRRFCRFSRANEAVSALEYAMLVGVIAVALSAALVLFSGQIEKALTNRRCQGWRYHHRNPDEAGITVRFETPAGRGMPGPGGRR